MEDTGGFAAHAAAIEEHMFPLLPNPAGALCLALARMPGAPPTLPNGTNVFELARLYCALSGATTRVRLVACLLCILDAADKFIDPRPVLRLVIADVFGACPENSLKTWVSSARCKRLAVPKGVLQYRGREEYLTATDVLRIRQKLGLDEDAFAKRMGATRSTVRRWEEGKFRMRANRAERQLGVRIHDLLT